MKFGEYLQQNLVAEWSIKYIDYDGLKKYIKKISSTRKATKNPDKNMNIVNDIDIIDDIVIDSSSHNDDGELLTKPIALDDGKKDYLAEDTHALSAVLKHSSTPRLPNDLSNIVPQHIDTYKYEVSFFRMLQNEITKVNEFSRQQRGQFASELNRLILLCRQYVKLKGDSKQKRRQYRQLKDACKELHHGLQLIENYRVLNYTACMKILKKHDKESEFQSKSKVVPYVVYAEFFRNSTESMIEKLQLLYVTVFANGDRSKGLQAIKVQPKEISHFVSFRVGLFVGLSTTLLIVLLFISRIIPDINKNSYFFAPFPVFRFTGLIILHMILFSIIMYAWEETRVNSQFIFEANPRTSITYSQLLEISTFMLVIWFSMLDLYLFSWAHDNATNNTGIIHLILFIVFVGVLFCPFNIFYHKTRGFFLSALRDVIITPFATVDFRGFFLADQLNSHVRTLIDLLYSVCFYTSSDFMNNEFHCKSIVSDGQWLVAILPAYWRLFQCLRRYYETSQRKHLMNAGKYTVSMTVTLFSIAQSKSASYTPVWIAFAIIGTMYTYYWDMIHDWGLFQPGYNGLRAQNQLLVKHKWVYYFAIVSNLMLRIAWVLTISPEAVGFDFAHELTVLFIAILEVYRRNQWNFFRLENEHLSNCGDFRAVKQMPVYLYDNDISNHDDDAISVISDIDATNDIELVDLSSASVVKADNNDDDEEEKKT